MRALHNHADTYFVDLLYSASPALMAYFMISALVFMCIFSSIRVRYVLTVFTLIHSVSAICVGVRPDATRRST